ncbi:hypothetical protein [Myroides odoratus]|uniref:SMI1 / KNR4 family n=1 Tax=Myroides odoratus TaxID=256 RepID=A0A378RIE9_MYROD|nr:hypothetical protein [Myroides odoratus]QQU05577.1 hypothetical protein I6I89_10375 [Myroides odoratus]STZ26803.1 Uncharacterised protein [Myroides odoratus]
MNWNIQQLFLAEKLPSVYGGILHSFRQFYVIQLSDGDDVEFYSVDKLVESFNQELQLHQAISQFFLDAASKHPVGKVYCRMSDRDIDVAVFKETFYFGLRGDYGRLFINLANQSIWEYWLDDGSVGYCAPSMDEFLQGSAVLAKDE